MIKTILFSVMISLVVVCHAEAQTSNLGVHPIIKSNLELLETWLSRNAAYQQQPGFAVAIVHDQEVLYAKGFGFSDVEERTPFTADTVTRIGSQSKLFTSIAIMQLHEEGKLSIEDPVAKHIPGLRAIDPAGNDTSVTIKQLLTHTAGLRSDGTLTLHWTELDFTTSEELDQEMRSLHLVSVPSTKRKYSNLGYAIAGRVVEVVSGMPFEEYVRTRVIAPLGLSSTFFNVIPEEARDRLAVGYGRRLPDGTRSEVERWNANAMTSAFGMHSTLNDLITFVKWQMSLAESIESDVLSPETIREVRRAHWTDPDWSGGWGLGFQVAKVEERTVYGLYGSVPGFFSSTYVDAEEKLGVIVVANSMDAQPYLGQPLSIQEQVFSIVGPALVRAKGGEVVPEPAADWSRYFGRYQDIWNDWYVLNYEGQLALFNPNTEDARSALFFLQGVDDEDHAFVIARGPDAQLVDEPLRFMFGERKDSAAAFEITGIGRALRASLDSGK